METRARSSRLAATVLSCVAIVCGLSPSPVRAGCAPAGTSHSDAILCSGTQAERLASGSGDDHVSMLADADVSIEPPASVVSPIAIDAGPGRDTVVNEGSVSITATQSMEGAGTPNGCDPSYRSSPTNSPQAIGIAGGAGDDTLENRGAITARSTAEPAPAANPASQCGASASLHGKSDRESTSDPAVSSTGVQGGDGHDVIGNSGTLEASATSSVDGQPVAATGIDAGDGDDYVVNSGTIIVTAASTPPNVAAPSVTAVGIDGGNGRDTVANDGTLAVDSTSSVGGTNVSLSLAGGDDVDATITLEAHA